MTRSPAPSVTSEADVLAPVRDALLALARRDAERTLAEADADAAVTLARAEADAEQVRSVALAEATADAQARVGAELSRINRESRAVELRARRAAYHELVARASEAMQGLSDEPGLRERLEALAHAELGASASVAADPGGGVVAESGERRVSYLLTSLAESVVAELLAEREGT